MYADVSALGPLQCALFTFIRAALRFEFFHSLRGVALRSAFAPPRRHDAGRHDGTVMRDSEYGHPGGLTQDNGTHARIGDRLPAKNLTISDATRSDLEIAKA